MKLLIVVFSIVVSSVAFSAQQISGKVERIGYRSFLKSSAATACYKYQLIPNTDEAEKSINRLSTGDSLTASAVLDNNFCAAYIDSVDYVGLVNLLGYWYNDEGYIRVHDFSSVTVYSQEFKHSKDKKFIDPVQVRYSITPSNGNEWILFLSTPEKTTFATIILQKAHATVKIYDSENGSVIRTIYLSKWGH
ncbi:MAG: hypothetical protein ACXVCY_05495 [Pseudobdellovibrionaceae bacterium]